MGARGCWGEARPAGSCAQATTPLQSQSFRHMHVLGRLGVYSRGHFLATFTRRSVPSPLPPPKKKKKKKRNSLGCGRNIHVFIWQNINFGALRNGTLSDVPSGVLYSNMDQSTSLVLSLRKQKPKCASFLDREGYVLEDKYDR